MKNINVLIFLLTTLIFTACSKQANTQEKTVDSVLESSSEAKQARIIEFLNNFYDDYVFGHNDFEQVKNNFSRKVLDKLVNAFAESGYECYDENGNPKEECYGLWIFRSGAQDGLIDVQQVNKVSYDGDDWYNVAYTDGGYDGTVQFHVKIDQTNKIIVLDFRNPDYIE